MRNPAQFSDRIPILAALCVGAILGGGLGAAVAQDMPPGQLDSACAAQCSANDNDAEFCTLACWVIDPKYVVPSEPADWKCYATCREKGGRQGDCLTACRKR